MNRQEKILKHIDKTGQGVEIGPSHNPVAPKSEGFRVHVIDHMSREELIEKYKDHGVDISRIEAVDFVWKDQSYSQLLGKQNHYDWVIASHVIEHTPDLIGFLNDCSEVLNDDGVISLVIPDKRYCFDHYRPITSLAQLIDGHLQKATIHSPGTVAEYRLNVVSRSGNIAWSAHDSGTYNFVHSLDLALKDMQSVLNHQVYIDVHAWCFVPHSFRLLMHDLYELGLIAVREIDFYPTEGCEFYITLGKQGRGVEQSRLELLNAIDEEIQAGIVGAAIAPTSRANRLIQKVKRLLKKVLRKTKNFLPNPS